MQHHQKNYRTLILLLLVSFALSIGACVSGHHKPCSEGGQSAREKGSTFQGIKKCSQAKDKSGRYVNDGKYYEYYQSDSLALKGEYSMGKKTGRWLEYDEKGRVTSDLYYQDGKEVPPPDQ